MAATNIEVIAKLIEICKLFDLGVSIAIGNDDPFIEIEGIDYLDGSEQSVITRSYSVAIATDEHGNPNYDHITELIDKLKADKAAIEESQNEKIKKG